jgi:hypothetical protein
MENLGEGVTEPTREESQSGPVWVRRLEDDRGTRARLIR